MWTFDPRLDNGYGLMIKDLSPFVIATRYFGADLHHRLGVFDRKYLNFSGFSFQELSCDDHFEDATKSCQKSVDSFQHLTVFFTPQRAVQFKYNTDFIPLDNSPMFNRFDQSLASPQTMGAFWPRITEMAKDYNFKADKSQIVSALYDPLTYYLYMGCYQPILCIV